ncbi:MAG: hypothetical protein K6E29_02790 [Cyanobacteria bacterium RUI128]|nr:hypothetical protein [Cyanobacteria bacterium RUI128]
MYISPSFAVNAYNRTNTQNRPQSLGVSCPKYSNLAPLSRDTVSFTSGLQDMEDVSNGINLKTAKLLYNDVQPAQKYLNRQIDRILGDLVRPEHGTGSLSKPIEIIRKRAKLPESIVEKSATRSLHSYDEVKYGLTDLAGAKIVMADTSKEAVDKVIGRLTEAVENGKLKILEIENYRPDPEINNAGEVVRTFDYSSPLALKNLKKACDDKSDTSIRKVDEDRPSGYMAIHLLVQLPGGFTGEIQIIGNEMERLKDVEDMCFKVKNGKHLPKKYASVEKMLSPIANKDDVVLRKEYSKYTRKAYLYQRDLEQNRNKRKKQDTQEFLHIPDYLPEALDFNNVAKEIARCNGRAKKHNHSND